ncbi:MAG: hypothetical protein KF724_09745 [Phycisphaeraceae bacterium]|nr:hypothetical protein [Phycisphaeraceae bacterium]
MTIRKQPPQGTGCRRLRLIAGAVVGWVAVALALPLVLPHSQLHAIHGGEESVIEFASVGLWVAAAIAIPVFLRRASAAVVAGMLLCLGAAARELDFHKRFTEIGLFKLKFFLSPDIGVGAKVCGVLVILVLAASIVLVGRAIWLHLRASGGWRSEWARCAALALGLLLFAKSLDAAPSTLKSAGVMLSGSVTRMMGSVEEHMEAAAPLIVVVGLALVPRRRRRQRPAASEVAIDPATIAAAPLIRR